MSEQPTVVFFPEGAFGPTNNCVGIGQVLEARGARVVFVVEESFAGTLEAQGFEEALMRLKPPAEVEEAPGQFWKDFVRETAPEFRKPTLEQLAGFVLPVWQELVDGARYVDERLREIFRELRPDVIVEDNVVGFPAVVAAGVPWVRIVSCNPLELKDPALPPAFSGYPAGDRSGWDEFRARYRELHEPLQRELSDFCVDRGAPPLPEGEFIHESTFLNLYLYPPDADYERSRPLGPAWHRLGSCVRRSDLITGRVSEPGRGVLYLSLGSLGSADVALMQKLIDTLAATDHHVIVSMGPQHDELALAPNMTGAEFLPQPAILPQVDLVITHGGNNTVTESLQFGKPMVVLPLFWDQHDNAQRMQELGLGRRLDTYGHEPEELIEAIEGLLADPRLPARLGAISRRLQAEPGTVKAADLIEGLVGAGPLSADRSPRRSGHTRAPRAAS
jgi:MGT family glycosyltransferase